MATHRKNGLLRRNLGGDTLCFLRQKRNSFSEKNVFVSGLCALARRTQIGHEAKKIAFVSKKNTPNLIVDTRDCQISQTQTQISRVDHWTQTYFLNQ